MKTKIIFEVCIIANIPKKHIATLKKQIEKTMSTTLDLSISQVTYSINGKDYIEVNNFEEDYTKLKDIE